MHTEITDNNVATVGCLFYDGDCPLCCRSASRFNRILAKRGFGLRPLQTPGVASRLGISERDLLREIRLLLADGRVLGGADAVAEIARHIWWAKPGWLLNCLPGVKHLFRMAYRLIAANRHCAAGRCSIQHRHGAFFKLP